MDLFPITATFLWTSRALPIWQGERGGSTLDGGAPFYGTYRTKDDKFVSIGPLEPQFYAELLKGDVLLCEAY